MKIAGLTGLLLAALLTSESAAAEYLEQVRSEVFQSPGTASELSNRAKMCAARSLAPGLQGGNIILSADDTGVVANNSVRYNSGLMEWSLRSKVLIETREGRFRITHTNIERLNNGSWSSVGKWTGSGWQSAETALTDISRSLSRCMLSAAQSDPF